MLNGRLVPYHTAACKSLPLFPPILTNFSHLAVSARSRNFYAVFDFGAGFFDVIEYANVPQIAIADPMTVFLSMASLNTTDETTMMITRLAVLRTEEVTDPTNDVNAKAHSL